MVRPQRLGMNCILPTLTAELLNAETLCVQGLPIHNFTYEKVNTTFPLTDQKQICPYWLVYSTGLTWSYFSLLILENPSSNLSIESKVLTIELKTDNCPVADSSMEFLHWLFSYAPLYFLKLFIYIMNTSALSACMYTMSMVSVHGSQKRT